jgi:RNA polymerase sigma factor (sigma-70 family)
MQWVDRLALEYADKRNQLRVYRDRLDRDDLQQRDERRIVNGMISDLNYSLEWMQTGRCPGVRRGADGGDAYRFTDLMDMDLLQLIEPEERPIVDLDPERKKQLVRILLKMSIRERQCFLLHTAQGLSYAEIGRQMKLTRASVQSYINRAKIKVQQGFA